MVQPLNVAVGEDADLDAYWARLNGLLGLFYAFEGCLQELSLCFAGNVPSYTLCTAPESEGNLHSGMYECAEQWILTNQAILRNLWDLLQSRSEHALSRVVLRPATQSKARASIVCWICVDNIPTLTQEWLFYRKGD